MRLEDSKQVYDINYVILCVIVSIFFGFMFAVFLYSVFSNGNTNDGNSSYFYQDLNSVEIKVANGIIDPDLVKAIHHFQKTPFGKLPEEFKIPDLPNVLVDVPKSDVLPKQQTDANLNCFIITFVFSFIVIFLTCAKLPCASYRE